ncbi:MAG: aminotransferase class IV family protein [Bacteroides sp.]
MCPFIETIRAEEGVLLDIDYHNRRMNDTRLVFWPDAKPLDLTSFLLPPAAAGVMKCRVVYSDIIEEVSYAPYSMRSVRTLRIVCSDTINYTYKSTDREALNQLYEQRNTKDDVLIIKNGYITDTSIANVALFDGTHWFTPKHPLLKGTQRAQLLQKGIIQEKEIMLEELFSFSQMTIFNAMIPFQSLVLDVNSAFISY